VSPTTRAEDAARLEAALTDPVLADLVEMVLRRTGADTYRAAAVDGSVEFRRDSGGDRPTYRVVATSGRDPLADGSTRRFVGRVAECGASPPDRVANSYPHAHDSVAQFFDSPHAPDLVATHTAAHFRDDHHGHHGSLAVVQARAPFIAAGTGVRADGMVDRSTRTVDIAPTVAALLGIAAHPDAVGPTGRRRADALLRRQDGEVDHRLLTGEVAGHVVVLLLDGCNANLLLDAVATGEAPNIAALVERGTAYRRGALASLPTATLANHTTALTGAHPGHTGVLHNTWVDRSDGTVPDLLDLGQMFHAMAHLSPEVETLFQALARSRPGAFSSAGFEFCDTGASFSTFALARSGVLSELPPLVDVRHLDRAEAAESEMYGFISRVDHLSVAHTIDCWEQRNGNPLPALSWCSLALTDEAGHASGPHGAAARAAVRDSDARVGEVLAAVERAGAHERTAVLVIADHGMEQCDPAVAGGWHDALADTGVAHREVGDGLIYLG